MLVSIIVSLCGWIARATVMELFQNVLINVMLGPIMFITIIIKDGS